MDLRVQYLGIVDLEVRKYERPIWFARRSDAFENLAQKLAAGQNTQFPTTSLFRSARLAAATEGGQQAVVVARPRPSLAVIERPSAVRPRSLGTISALLSPVAGERLFGGTREVGIYGEQVLPRIVNVACGMEVAREQRQRVCEGLHGQVVEVGFGSGLNVPFYPDAVSSVVAIEPADVGWKLAAKRLASSNVPVERSGLDGQSLPLPDDSCDTALTTWTLCTIPDVETALLELRRVLKPGGTLHFVEHGLAPDDSVRRWQHRLEPIQKRVFGGCHLTRPTVDLLKGAGLTISELDVYYEKGVPKALGANSLGVARAP